MIEVHASLHRWRQDNRENLNASDPIPPLARDIAKKTAILCFDELQVSDIADAMILSRLFTELFKNGVVVVATSNRHPDDLYKDGLQRERFLPFIELVKEKMQITTLDSHEDYRLIHLKAINKVYYSPLDKNAHKFMESVFHELTNGARPVPFTFNIAGRKLIIPKTYNDVAWVKFSDLCEKSLGAADYIEIARGFGTLLLEGVPKIGREQRNEAKRFVILIDALYEHKVKLIVTAETAPDKLYSAGDGSFEFQRTTSRLIEMQSQQYLMADHIG
jgi:cell division protein ZapE